MATNIKDPLIELLAIKLYEHDHKDWPPKTLQPGWISLPEEDREPYRNMAAGRKALPGE